MVRARGIFVQFGEDRGLETAGKMLNEYGLTFIANWSLSGEAWMMTKTGVLEGEEVVYSLETEQVKYVECDNRLYLFRRGINYVKERGKQIEPFFTGLIYKGCIGALVLFYDREERDYWLVSLNTGVVVLETEWANVLEELQMIQIMNEEKEYELFKADPSSDKLKPAMEGMFRNRIEYKIGLQENQIAERLCLVYIGEPGRFEILLYDEISEISSKYFWYVGRDEEKAELVGLTAEGELIMAEIPKGKIKKLEVLGNSYYKVCNPVENKVTLFQIQRTEVKILATYQAKDIRLTELKFDAEEACFKVSVFAIKEEIAKPI